MNKYAEHFAKVDLYFAKTFTEDEDVFLFLAYVFKRAREGHLCVKIEDAQNEVYATEIKKGAEKVKVTPIPEALIYEGGKWYLKRNYECEKNLHSHFLRLKCSSSEKVIFEDRHGLNEEQKKCALQALENPLTFICGGPGTGKTRTAVAIISHFQDKRVAITAPTGKASANLRAQLKNLATSNEKWVVTTLQGLLRKKKETYLPFDLIVVDESSMIDAFLMDSLFSSIFEGTKLILLGDTNQLPPVGVGQIFSDLAALDKTLVAPLHTCLRAELKEVLEIAKAVNDRKMLPLLPLPKPKEIVEQVAKKLSLNESHSLQDLFALYRQFRVIAPQRKGAYGVETLNELLYQHHKKLAGFLGGILIPIIIKVNDYELDLHNGDFGFLDITKKEAYFEDGKKILSPFLPPFEYSYLLSVHKSQGSEYDEVMVLLATGSELFGKEMLYTAVTRAKKKVTIFGEADILEKIYQNDTKKFSGLQ